MSFNDYVFRVVPKDKESWGNRKILLYIVNTIIGHVPKFKKKDIFGVYLNKNNVIFLCLCFLMLKITHLELLILVQILLFHLAI